ncbi:competence type IV pilus minor pilin ComGD [Alkalihalophilus pseudofirmus]|uniref:Competence type IV pilus minor pilin ComGD n=1 Tax=Alkalihalophilus pseudofirmus TaxID=79885 RepID=A0AAJ2NNM4_ALKPS|nr:competence type IV pilus minor pilin ComGD [Alkalihalophilus pseudofirmus]MDV2885588.1 competence type IV pilus minor pilin ComGD [Alkalihalophilus pseudofirmus]
MKTVKLLKDKSTYSQAGYTFTELLITLSIFSMLVLLPIIYLPTSMTTYKTKEIADQFKEDILLAQHLAMSRGEMVTIKISGPKKEYRILGNKEVFLERPFADENMAFASSTLPNIEIVYLANGNPRFSGTMHLNIQKESYAYTILLGKGRVHYRKL